MSRVLQLGIQPECLWQQGAASPLGGQPAGDVQFASLLVLSKGAAAGRKFPMDPCLQLSVDRRQARSAPLCGSGCALCLAAKFPVLTCKHTCIPMPQ